VELPRCPECGRELLFLRNGPAPERCEDCRPQTGPGSPLVDQLGRNLRQLRIQAGIERGELARRSRFGPSEIAKVEEEPAREVRTTTLLRLCHSLGASIEEITERIYWNPAEFKSRENGKPVWLAGFFLVPPSNVSAFELDSDPVEVKTRQQAAHVVGSNVRAARERRHLTQARLASKAGLSRSGLSLLERGIREATLTTLLSLARALQVPPELLLSGIEYRRGSEPGPPSRCGGARCYAARSRDREIVRLWNAGHSTAEIAEAIATTPGSVSTMIHRLRERGEPLPYRRPPLLAVQQEARLRRGGAEGQLVDWNGKTAIEAPKGKKASVPELAARIGANLGAYRRRSGMSLRQLADGAHLDRARIYQLERGRDVPTPAVLIKLAACLNVRCSALTAGIEWNPAVGIYRVEEPMSAQVGPLQRLGRNALAARRRLGFSQEALASTSSLGRYDISDFEAGRRAFRVFTLVRVAAALEEGLADLFANVADWYVRPLRRGSPPAAFTR
jgi:transcriptional regulator with XRE-family HTH domain